MTGLSRRTLLAAAGTALTGTAGCLGSGSADADDGISLPAVDVDGSPGGEVGVREAGQAALLDFFATWCAPCKPQMEFLGSIRDANPDLQMVSITQESDRAAIRTFWQEYDGRWPVAVDRDLRATEAYGVQNIPTLIALAPDGTEVWRHVGLASEESIAAAVAEARR